MNKQYRPVGGNSPENVKELMEIDKENWNKVKKILYNNDLNINLSTRFASFINSDIKSLGFLLSRYKFATKMLKYKERVTLLELGCNEAWGANMFKQNIDLCRYVGVDLDSDAIWWNKENLSEEFEFIEANFFDDNLTNTLGKEQFNAIVSLDVIEHISPSMEDNYCKVIMNNLSSDGCAIIGTPSIKMIPYASEANKIGHINLYDQNRLYNLFSKYFNNVFIFGMNDEVVNTGFEPMACYIFAVCCNKINER